MASSPRGCRDAARLNDAIAKVEAAVSGWKSGNGPCFAGCRSSQRGTDAIYVQAVGLINEKRYEEAIAQLDNVWAAGRTPDILTYLGFANRKLHKYDVAEAIIRLPCRSRRSIAVRWNIMAD